MPTECTPRLFAFEEVEGKSVVADFDGGEITSNAGALLLGQVDRGVSVVKRFAACFTDRRDPRFVEHQVETLVGSGFSRWRWAMRTSTITTSCARTPPSRCWPAS